MKKSIGLAVAVVFICATLTGCTSFFDNSAVTGFSGSQHGTVMNAHFNSFHGEKGAKIPLKQGDVITINYSLTCDSGTLTLTFEDKDGGVLFTNAENTGVEESATVTADASGTYTLRLAAADAKLGSYDLTWSVDTMGESQR